MLILLRQRKLPDHSSEKNAECSKNVEKSYSQCEQP